MVRRWLADLARIARGWTGRRIYPLTVNLYLPHQKTVNIKKNGQIIKIIKVRRKSKYFNARSACVFLFIKNIFLFLVKENKFFILTPNILISTVETFISWMYHESVKLNYRNKQLIKFHIHFSFHYFDLTYNRHVKNWISQK